MSVAKSVERNRLKAMYKKFAAHWRKMKRDGTEVPMHVSSEVSTENIGINGQEPVTATKNPQPALKTEKLGRCPPFSVWSVRYKQWEREMTKLIAQRTEKVANVPDDQVDLTWKEDGVAQQDPSSL